MKEFLTKHSLSIIVGLGLLCVIFMVTITGLAIYIAVRMSAPANSVSSTDQFTDTASSDTAGELEDDYIYEGLEEVANSYTITEDKIQLDLNNKTVVFKYDKNILGQPTVDVSRYVGGDATCYSDGRYAGSVSFFKSDIKLNFNACGLGGISEEEVGKFTVKTKSGETFNISYTNCVKVREVYPTEADYLQDLNTIGKTCRGYYLGSSHIGEKINIHLMFDTTVAEVETINQQLRQIISSMEITNKMD